MRELDSLLKRQADLEQMLRQERVRLQELAARPGIARGVLASLEQVIAALEGALAELEQAIARHLKAHRSLARELRRLRQIPGIGPKKLFEKGQARARRRTMRRIIAI